ncbi:nickel pincer cofactor biosynthesis protein LarB [Lignipirellula cremea]|uniref:AIR carboxylase n=1 Tax=Lignipirellula cremea TaxID=2528010 RepID=A0A518DN91_9BACT|nr:nickel pincer cofactor biosynthesis protein LarB [Lignipirellula cremea]QDU93305.1 AIR carboxylase [Lignipirellula cremea]
MRDLLEQLADDLLAGKLTRDQFLQQASEAGVARLPEAMLDLDRAQRCGYPEVIFGEGKTAAGVISICQALCEKQQAVLATRVDAEKAAALMTAFPAGNYNAVARTFRLATGPAVERRGFVAVVTAGSGDIPVAEEARETLDWMGVETAVVTDVGVAGPHRLPMHLETLRRSDAIVVAAGMEGALPSVVGGFVSCPVFAVPTSVGYGASFGGLAALLGMLNSCAANVAVVNIDAGFKAGYLAGMVAQRAAPPA